LKQTIILCAAAFALTAPGTAKQPPRSQESASPPTRKHVYVDGKPIPSNQVIVKDGVSFVDASTLAKALGASVQTGAGGVTIRTAKPSCDQTVAEGQRFSPQFRSDVAGVADEIESLRAVVLKKEQVPLGPRFDAIDRKLALATAHVQTDADMAVYYALSYANNSLAIAYYKLVRGVPVEEAQRNQLDSMMCSMESKFALMKGVLLPGGSCSVFKRMEAQLPPTPSE
jgi:hypothetical protein